MKQQEKIKEERKQKDVFHIFLQILIVILGFLTKVAVAMITVTVLNFLWHQTMGKEERKIKEPEKNSEKA